MSALEHSTQGHLKLKKIRSDLHFPDDKNSSLPYLGKEITACTTILVSDSEHEIEGKVEDDLAHHKIINWCRTIHNVHPLKVTGQGNQFLQAVSLVLWSFCDAANLLQRLLFVSMSEFAKDKIFERWIRIENSMGMTIELNFKGFVDMARCSSDGEASFSEIVSHEFPHPLHIFILANIIRRPIVIVGDEREAHTGIYLPVLSKPEDCTKWPLVLAVYNHLFFPLVNKECSASQKKLAEFAIPLVSYELQPIKVVFLLEAEENEVFTLLQKYLNTTELNLTRSSGVCLILSAKLNNMPFEFAGSPLPSVNDKQSSSDPRHVVPSAPSASIITLNNLSESSPCIEETEREMSMLQETCCIPGCHLFVSRYTEPYCWEHVDQQSNSVAYQNGSAQRSSECVEISLVNERCKEARCPHFASRFIYPYCYEHIDKKTVECIVRKKPMPNQLPPECSVVMEYCQHGNCRNYASQYVYPFCYLHINDHTAQTGASANSTSRANEPVINREYDMSIMAELCAHPNCDNHASKYTFPVCYEHLGSPHAITRAASATRVVQLPHAGQRPIRLVNGAQQSVVPKQVAQAHGSIDKKFEETMRELEERTRKGQICLEPGCSNFGNSRCRGYCHSCYNSPSFRTTE